MQEPENGLKTKEELAGMLDRAVDLAPGRLEKGDSPYEDLDDVFEDMVEAIHRATNKPLRYIRRVFKSKFGLTVRSPAHREKTSSDAA